jgi:metallo-beta-lactamase superfamily protein
MTSATFRYWQAPNGHGAVVAVSVIGATTDDICSQRVFRLLTRKGHSASRNSLVQQSRAVASCAIVPAETKDRTGDAELNSKRFTGRYFDEPAFLSKFGGSEMNRRHMIGTMAGTFLSTFLRVSSQAASSGGTRVVLLGTAGGPSPKVSRAAPASMIVAGGALYVVDCGNGVARQIVRAGYQLKALRSIFITHHHSDHNLDYGNLFYLAWSAALKDPVNSYGPPPLVEMTKKFFELNAFDIDLRVRDEGRPNPVPLLVPHEITGPGAVFKDENVAVRAARRVRFRSGLQICPL